LDDIPNHRIINDDAYRVVVEPDKFGLDAYSFDAVVADAFIGDKVSDLASSGNFLAALKRLVKPVGLVVFNRVYLHRHQDDVDNFVELLEEFFRNIESRTVAGHTNSDNLIIYGRT